MPNFNSFPNVSMIELKFPWYISTKLPVGVVSATKRFRVSNAMWVKD